MHSIQTELQYVYVHRALLDYFEYNGLARRADIKDFLEQYKQQFDSMPKG